jgi:hypothetical protein
LAHKQQADIGFQEYRARDVDVRRCGIFVSRRAWRGLICRARENAFA